jgi:hypothetical protein
MGKRELVIIATFLLVGALAYQLTAPPAVEGRGFSLSRLIQGVKSEVNPASGRHVHTGTWAATGSLRELRLDSIRELSVTGEDRADIAYELSVHSTGPDEETAAGYARRTVLETDDLGDVLMIGIEYPPEASQTASLVLKVPRRLAVRLEGRCRATLSDVAALHLDRSSGETRAELIAGEVTGTHLGGPLTITGADAIDVTLRTSRATFTEIRRGVRINASSGTVTVQHASGPVEVEQSNAEVRVAHAGGPVRVGGTGGEVIVEQPGDEVRVDTRRAEVELVLERAVPATVITTDEVLRLVLLEETAVAVEAIAARGDVNAVEFGLTAAKSDDAATLKHAFGAAGAKTARVLLRNERGDIVIRKRK